MMETPTMNPITGSLIPIELLVEHALLRMAITGKLQLYAINNLPADDLAALCYKLCDRKFQRSQLIDEMENKYGIASASFYRFAAALEAAAKEVHAEMIGGGFLPALVTPKDAAFALRVGVEDVEQLIESGRLPSVAVGDHHRIDRVALGEFVKGNPVKPKSDRRNDKGRYVSNNSARPSAQRPASTGDNES